MEWNEEEKQFFGLNNLTMDIMRTVKWYYINGTSQVVILG